MRTGGGEQRILHAGAERVVEIDHKAVSHGDVRLGNGSENGASVSGNQATGDCAADAQGVPLADDPASGDFVRRDAQGIFFRAVKHMGGLAVCGQGEAKTEHVALMDNWAGGGGTDEGMRVAAGRGAGQIQFLSLPVQPRLILNDLYDSGNDADQDDQGG